MPTAITEPPTPIAITGKQKVALMLARGGYTHTEIAEKLGLRHRSTVTRLIGRGRKSEKAFAKAVQDHISAA